jgi:dolichol-phosphate mannosyltransferase
MMFFDEDAMSDASLLSDDRPACRVSIMAPCYNEEECLPEFYRRAKAACEAAAGQSYEIVLVDDGSKDRTWSIIENFSRSDPHVVGVKLLRNHGHQLAVTAGLAATRGERVMMIDADLQDPPELLAEMMPLMDQGADVVYGQRSEREGETAFKKISAKLFYRMLARMSDVNIPIDAAEFKLMSRRIVDILNAMPERQRYIAGLVSWIGGRQVPLVYHRKERFAGETKYPLKKMVLHAINAFTSFSIVPLRMAFYVGVLSTVIAFALMGWTIVQWLRGSTIVGWASLMAVVAFFAGAQLAVLGVIGEYLGRLVQESKGRPVYLVETTIENGRPRQTAHGVAGIRVGAGNGAGQRLSHGPSREH